MKLSHNSPWRSTSLWVLLGICLVAFFWRLGNVSLFDLDEALYVGSARQMVQSGDYITPRLNSRPPYDTNLLTVPFFEKPILVYWLSALSMRLFGISEFAARLPVALAGVCAVLLLFAIGTRWFGRRAGFFAGLLYATAPMTIIDARQMTTDGLLVLWFMGMMFAFARLQRIGEQQNETRNSEWRTLLLFWLCCSLAILTKGAIGVLLPALVIGYYAFTAKHVTTLKSRLLSLLQTLQRLRPLLGLTLMLLVVAPWHIAVSKGAERDAQGRTFVQEYVVRQHIGRFRGGDTVHNAPLPTYIAYFLVGFFPWACFAPVAFRRKRLPTQTDSTESDSTRFLLVWFWVIFLFFTVGAAKLPTYIVPAYPAAALLFGKWLDTALQGGSDRALKLGAFAAMLTTLLLAFAAKIAPRFAPPHNPIPEAVLQLAQHITLILAIGCTLAWVCFLVSKSKPTFRIIGISLFGGMMLTFVLFMVTEGYSLIQSQVSGPYQRVARSANTFGAQGIPIIYYNISPRRPSMLFYSTYSPYERKEAPLSPMLLPILKKRAVVITSLKSYTEKLLPELTQSPNLHWQLVEQQGAGRETWVLIRIDKD